MLDLILIIFLIASLFKPDVLLSKKMREQASDEQKAVLVKNLRKIYALLVASLESLGIIRYSQKVGVTLAVIFIALFFIFAIPAIKENSKIKKEIEGQKVEEEKGE